MDEADEVIRFRRMVKRAEDADVCRICLRKTNDPPREATPQEHRAAVRSHQHVPLLVMEYGRECAHGVCLLDEERQAPLLLSHGAADA